MMQNSFADFDFAVASDPCDLKKRDSSEFGFPTLEAQSPKKSRKGPAPLQINLLSTADLPVLSPMKKPKGMPRNFSTSSLLSMTCSSPSAPLHDDDDDDDESDSSLFTGLSPLSPHPHLDKPNFELLLQMSSYISPVTSWVRPSEILGVFSEDLAEDDESPTTSDFFLSKSVVSSASTVAACSEADPSELEPSHDAAPPRKISKRSVRANHHDDLKPKKAPRASRNEETSRVVPSARCIRCATKKKKCNRINGVAACVACQKYAGKAGTEEESQQRLESCTIPLVYNQRGLKKSEVEAILASGATIANIHSRPELF